VGHKEEWDLQAVNAGLRQQIAELRERLIEARERIEELEVELAADEEGE
jgi:hypothetical protein